MIIHHKGIYHDRFDAPFVGTLIAAVNCYGNCKGCFHQDRLNGESFTDEADSILKRANDSFSKGIILGYLEWLDTQYDEALYLIDKAINQYHMEVLLYTRRYKEDLIENYPELFKYKGLYIKCGPYDETQLDPTYSSLGVPLASRNQYIIQI